VRWVGAGYGVAMFIRWLFRLILPALALWAWRRFVVREPRATSAT
jgi:hypothetical protein